MARQPQLTDDTHLHGKTAEQVYRIHHAMNPETGDPLPGVEVNDDECGCAHCVSHVESDPAVLDAARETFKANEGKQQLKQKVSKGRR